MNTFAGEHEIAFFDSNVLIASEIPNHFHHGASFKLLSSLQTGGGAMAAHSLAEAYNNLTRIKRGYGLPSSLVMKALEHASQTYSIVTLRHAEMMAAIANAADLGLAGAVIYDALIVACARKLNAAAIYTYNGDDFQRVAPDLANIIREP